MESNETMRALVQRSHRGPDDLILTDVRRPSPGAGEYLVRVGAAGVNFADVMQTYGRYGGGPKPPYAAGFEAAGEIVGIGPEVPSALPVGTHVIGAGTGAFSEYVVMQAAEVLPVPTGWSDAEALGLVLNWATALAALKPLGGLEPGETVLIHAAAGGVGQAAVRLARHYGARVIATAALAKHDTVRALGADEVVDSACSDLAAEVARLTGGVDLVLESVGRTTFAASMSAAKPITGRVVVYGASSGDAAVTTHDLVFTSPVQLKGLHIGAFAAAVPTVYRSMITELQELVAQGVYPPGRSQLHALADGPAVLRELEAGRTTGKHALDPWR
ncbi:NADPH:quinone reductase-like Zn-dependent oxidoreductase [Kribbella voronezhensis]|uniref:NADPH:quinone reductase-like Zn-dependent oxidoreductase n=1 Tax=Kribbella voronezhensis TaxID=2512212 RepID=A0A4R7TEY4_9ACTN|nr:zinc-binding dehydrogenase [Kribbella voronezhensis]TDU89978.1 NADPH:quinone reductase-like Zn-dependent oxidoreductase [Kribbella voronezhensis]